MALKKHFFFILVISLFMITCSSDDDAVKPSNDQVDTEDSDDDDAKELTFTKLSTGTESSLFSIHFLNETTGFMAGGTASVLEEEAVILKSADGGKSWTEVYSEAGFYITKITSPTEEILFASTSDGFILKSDNAGEQWEKVDIQSGVYWSSIHFINSQTGILVGSNSAGHGKLFTTNDGGESWQSIINITPLENNPLNEIALVDNNTILVSGGSWDNGTVIKSTNTGVDWKVVNVSDEVKIRDIFMDGNKGYAVGDNGQVNSQTEKGILFKTTDGGENWVNVDTEYGNRLRCLAMNGNIGCVAGLNRADNLSDPEFLMMSFDGGENWKRINHEFGLAGWNDVSFITDKKMLLTGYNGLAVIVEVSE